MEDAIGRSEVAEIEPFVIQGDGRHLFTYAKFMTMAGCVISLGAFPSAVRAGGVHWLIPLCAPMIMGTFAALICWTWKLREFRVSYIIDRGELSATRNGKVLRPVPLAQISNVTFIRPMSVRSYFVRYWPLWPYLSVSYIQGIKHVSANFPDIMLWDEEMDRAEERLRRQLGL